jgi:[ribosomal protein S5]-alanine N-acetyltransferase
LHNPDRAIDTARLRLRLVELDDAGDICRYARDPAVAEHTSWTPHQSMADSVAFVSFVRSRDSAEPGSIRHVWAVRLRDAPDAIGTVDFVQDAEDEGHIDYVLARPHWGKGLMTEAVGSVASWAFARLPRLSRIRSGCLVRNTGSMRVLEKVGFVRVGTHVIRAPDKAAHVGLEAADFLLTRADFERDQNR